MLVANLFNASRVKKCNYWHAMRKSYKEICITEVSGWGNSTLLSTTHSVAPIILFISKYS